MKGHMSAARIHLYLLGLDAPQVRGPENEDAFARLDAELNVPRQLRAPSPYRPHVDFVLAVDASGRPYLPEPVRVLAVGVCSSNVTRDVVIESDELPCPTGQRVRRYLWSYGDPAPAVLAELGIEVVAPEPQIVFMGLREEGL